MEISQLIPHVEALIFAADRPLPAADILELLNNALAFLEDRATAEQVAAAIEAIQEKYSSEFYAFSVRESGGGYQFLTKKDYYQTVAQINGEKFLKRLSTAALETLAIIAYKQPISKGEIEHIRGVSTDYSITKLLEKELIVISGRSEELPGKPLLYSTSKAFMDYFGLNSPADLPKLKEVFEEDFVPPTQLTLEAVETLEVDEEVLPDGHLVVTESGELTETTTIVMEDEPTEEHQAPKPPLAMAATAETTKERRKTIPTPPATAPAVIPNWPTAAKIPKMNSMKTAKSKPCWAMIKMKRKKMKRRTMTMTMMMMMTMMRKKMMMTKTMKTATTKMELRKPAPSPTKMILMTATTPKSRTTKNKSSKTLTTG